MKLKYDLYVRCYHTYGIVNTMKMLRAIASPGASAIVLFRISEFLQKNRLGFLAFIITNINYHWNSILIGHGVSIEEGFVITHSLGVIINGQCKIGKNLIIEHGVTIGSKGNNFAKPIIGNNVYIGAGAKLIGPIKIGNNVKIGANSVVVSDIPDNVTIVGIPAKIVKH